MDAEEKSIARLLVCAILAITLAACQTGSKDLQVRKSDFGITWSTYKACRGSQTLRDVAHQAEILEAMAAGEDDHHFPGNGRSSSFGMTTLFTSNKPRLSADPQIMALDCWLHAGNLAAATGRDDLAYIMYLNVLRLPQTAENSYYMAAARSGLIGLHRTLQAAASGPSKPSPN